MINETKSYTFTARSSRLPAKVATFTLNNGHVAISLGEALMAQADQAVAEARAGEENQLRSWGRPLVTGLLQQKLPAVHVRDIDATFDDGELALTTWLRAGDLRLLPARVVWEEVDNPDAARAFVRELQARQADSQHPGRFKGLADYWVAWIAAGIVAVTLPWRWWQQRKRADGETSAAGTETGATPVESD